MLPLTRGSNERDSGLLGRSADGISPIINKKNIPIAIVATLFGVLVWISVVLQEEHSLTLSAPLIIEDVGPGKAIRTPVPRNVQLKFRGEGWRLAILSLRPEMRLVFSYPSLTAGDRAITFADIADRIAIGPGVQLIDVTPDSVIVNTERAVQKSIPVVFDCQMQYREGYGLVGKVSIQPESVVVRGAESVVARVESWPTVRRILDDLKAPVDADVPLAESPLYDLSFSASTVRVRLDVEPFAEKEFSGLPVEVLHVPVTREVILIPPKIQMYARGGIKQLSALSAADFHVVVDYEKIASDTTGFVDMGITGPEGIQIVRKRPERLQYIVRKRL